MVICRGEIRWASMNDPVGSEPGFRHPLVIVQSDDFNRSRIGTVVAAIITSNVRLSEAPGNLLLSKKESRLARDSVINVSQLVTIDKAFLEEPISKLSPERLSELDYGLRLVLAI